VNVVDFSFFLLQEMDRKQLT